MTVSYKYWCKDFIRLYPHSEFHFLSSTNISKYTNKALIFPTKPELREDQNFAFAFLQSLHRFYRNTTYKWYIRTTEDCFIDVRKLQSLIDDLESKYDPLNEIVFIGQLCRIDEDFAFIHGGSGWIMSRKAAEIFENNEKFIVDTYFNGIGGDDTMTDIMIRVFNLTDEKVHDSRILGTRLDDNSTNALISNDFSMLENCPKGTHIANTPIQFNKIIFWHSGRKDTIPVVCGYDILNRVPDYVYVTFKPHWATICRKY